MLSSDDVLKETSSRGGLVLALAGLRPHRGKGGSPEAGSARQSPVRAFAALRPLCQTPHPYMSLSPSPLAAGKVDGHGQHCHVPIHHANPRVTFPCTAPVLAQMLARNSEIYRSQGESCLLYISWRIAQRLRLSQPSRGSQRRTQVSRVEAGPRDRPCPPASPPPSLPASPGRQGGQGGGMTWCMVYVVMVYGLWCMIQC